MFGYFWVADMIQIYEAQNKDVDENNAAVNGVKPQDLEARARLANLVKQEHLDDLAIIEDTEEFKNDELSEEEKIRVRNIFAVAKLIEENLEKQARATDEAKAAEIETVNGGKDVEQGIQAVETEVTNDPGLQASEAGDVGGKTSQKLSYEEQKERLRAARPHLKHRGEAGQREKRKLVEAPTEPAPSIKVCTSGQL